MNNTTAKTHPSRRPVLLAAAFVYSPLLLALAAAPVIAGGYGYSSGYSSQDHSSGETKHGKDIVDTASSVASSVGSFKTLVTAVKEAGLVETLKGEGPFTLFAPTDEAFAKIPAKDLNTLLADKAALTAVLTYHVVPGRVLAEDVVKLDSAKTVQGQEIRIDTRDGVKVEGANVIKADLIASNGVIHVIDSVIMPN